jgi:hypothetical protein
MGEACTDLFGDRIRHARPTPGQDCHHQLFDKTLVLGLIAASSWSGISDQQLNQEPTDRIGTAIRDKSLGRRVALSALRRFITGVKHPETRELYAAPVIDQNIGGTRAPVNHQGIGSWRATQDSCEYTSDLCGKLESRPEMQILFMGLQAAEHGRQRGTPKELTDLGHMAFESTHVKETEHSRIFERCKHPPITTSTSP